jgi:small subunit ribosomal protein S20
MAQGIQIKIKKQKPSVLKRGRQTVRRTAVNRRNRSMVRTAVKKFRAAVAAGDAAAAEALLRPTMSALDTAARHGVLHRSTADRQKSRLTASYNRLRAAK